MNAMIGITCRQNSRRFPAKALAPVDYMEDSTPIPSFEYCYNRCKEILQTHVLTSDESNLIIDHCKKTNISYLSFENEKDVLLRFIKLAELTNADYVIRVTADDIFTSAEYVTDMLHYAEELGLEYIFPVNHIKGCECEIFKVSRLKKVYQSLDESQKNKSEYLSWYFRDVPGIKQSSFLFGHTKGYKVELDTVNDYYLRVLPLIYASKRDKFEINPLTVETYFDKNTSLQE